MRMTTAVLALALGVASNASSQPSHTHWEPYKKSSAEVLDLVAEHELTPAAGHVTPDETLLIRARVVEATFKANPARLLVLEDFR